MTQPATLMTLSGADLTPPLLKNACLVLIDIQNEYTTGPLALPDFDSAAAAASLLLARARSAGTKIFHVAHKGKEGGLFDRVDHRGQIADIVAPAVGETVIEKPLPNAFAGTDLASELAATGHKDLIIAGFMTHMCVSSTARVALDLGYRVTVEGTACATRALPDTVGGALTAQDVHRVALAELADRFAIVTNGHSWT